MSEEEIGGLKELFKMIDTDDSGTITFDELKEGLRRVGSELTEHEIQALMDAVRIEWFTILYAINWFTILPCYVVLRLESRDYTINWVLQSLKIDVLPCKNSYIPQQN